MYQTEKEVTTNAETSTYTGRVKWFNNKAGYGFITVCDGEHAGKDIFVHYSSICSSNPQYKYLVQGEYVDFCITKPEGSDHEYHAVAVGGVKGGNLMCETRRENIAAAVARKQNTAAVPVATKRAETNTRNVNENTKKPRSKVAASSTTARPRTERNSMDSLVKMALRLGKSVTVMDKDGSQIVVEN